MTRQNRVILGAVGAITFCGGASFAASYKWWPIALLCGLIALVIAIITAPVIAANERD